MGISVLHWLILLVPIVGTIVLIIILKARGH